MIAPLRARHRVVFFVLAVALPIAFIGALAARDDERGVAELPSAITADARELERVTHQFVGVSGERAFHAKRGEPRELLAVAQSLGPSAPDLLVYWSLAAPLGEELPAGAILLGSLGELERCFELPPPALESHGVVVLFSLAHFEVAGVIRLDAGR